MWNTVFASSLLSLISPWAGSRDARGRTARAPRTPAPPPPPRRHSDPATAHHAHSPQKTPHTTHRRFSDTRHTKPGLDLRQELLQLNLSTRDVDKWLGSKFDEKEEDYEVDFRFAHDIPLQRTISLDRGIDIFNYLQTLSESSDSASDAVSFWTIGSDDGSGLRVEQYRSFDDIPASPFKAKSRHVSVDVTNTMLGNSLAFSVLKESYKGLDAESGTVTPHIRKLQKTFSFKSFDEYRESAKSSTENLARVETEVDLGRIEMRHPTHVCRSISFESENENKSPRQRRFGVTSNAWQDNSSNTNILPKPNLIHFKSCDDVFVQDGKHSRLRSVEAIDRVSKVTFLEDKKDKICQSDAIRNIRKLRRNLLMHSKSECRELGVPKIIVTEVDSSNEIDVANIEKDIILRETSNLVEIGRNCDCSICSGNEGEQKVSFLSRNLNRIFVRLVSYKEYGRKLAFWDENNNLNENEMFSCFIHIMKLLLGLWLRHSDHKQHNLCA
ncbi:uncharacterized protein Rilpl isoform X1 [Maniola hyperantus]|uniref:uncharacterized protein Rilpl isoform X1 n=1 Tax=Aphantopus hyperantus TaxID=2795564 RepID=UPI00374A07C4